MRFRFEKWCGFASIVVLSACSGELSGNGGESGLAGAAPNAGPLPGQDTDGDGIPDISDPDSDGDGVIDSTIVPGVDPADPNAAGPMPLRRLNRQEYNNTVRDLLGTASRPADDFPLDRDGKFLFPRAGTVSVLDAELLRDAAESLAANADLGTWTPCDVAQGDETCARQFVESFGRDAFRRPLATAETDRLMQLYQNGRTVVGLDFGEALRLVVEGVLQSPACLYRWELGPNAPTLEGPVAKLNSYEIASRLSYFLWRSMPDQALFDAAAANQLGTQEEVAAQVERLLNDPRARDAIGSFFGNWLSASAEQIAARDKDPELYPEFGNPLATAMVDGTRAFAENVVFDGAGTFDSLLTSSNAFVDESLAGVYGVPGVVGSDLTPVALDATQRGGILTRAGFLTVTGSANGSNPVKRGHRIYESLLCRELAPPAGVDIPPPDPPEAGGTTRDRFARHAENACAGCHLILDPLGFAFEHYDGIGRWRDMDNGLPVDASGTTTLDGVDVTFNDGIELSQKLAASAEVRNCFATQWARYAFDRFETDYDRASIESAAAAFVTSGDSIRSLIEGIATSRSFRYRALAAGEMGQ